MPATGKIERGEYRRLLRDAQTGEFGHILMWSLDRLSREETFTDATQAIIDLEKAGVRFHSFKKPMLDTPDDGQSNLGRDVPLALLPVIAAFEPRPATGALHSYHRARLPTSARDRE